MKKMFMVNLEKCTGCEACTDACSGPRIGMYWEAASRIRILKDEPRTVFIPLVCEHCDEHPCVDACPVDAINFDEKLSIYVVDSEECIACGSCQEACPYQGIFVNENTALKCDLCGGDPSCVKLCYAGALQWVDSGQQAMEADMEHKKRKLDELKGVAHE